jgi:hypothetical protein
VDGTYGICPACGTKVNLGPEGPLNLIKVHLGSKTCNEAKAKKNGAASKGKPLHQLGIAGFMSHDLLLYLLLSRHHITWSYLNSQTTAAGTRRATSPKILVLQGLEATKSSSRRSRQPLAIELDHEHEVWKVKMERGFT